VAYGPDSDYLPTRAQERYQLFISYSGEDRELVAPFVAQLEADGFTIFFDQRKGLQPGGLMPQLADALDASDHVVACLTPAYLRGKWPLFELANAAHADPTGAGGRIVPVWFSPHDAGTLNYLQHLVHFDLSRHDPYGKSYAALRAAIRERLAHPAPDEVGQVIAEDDPEVTLFRIRQAGRGLARHLYYDLLHADPGRRTLEDLADDLLRSGKISGEPAAALGILRAFGERVLADSRTGDELTAATVTRALDALERLRAWTFPGRPGPASVTAAGPPAIELVALNPAVALPVPEQITPVPADLAWPVGDHDVLVWEATSGVLRCFRGAELRWRDTERIDVRRVDTAVDGRLALGGWEGRVCYFVRGPEPAAVMRLDGAIGDLRCAPSGLVAGSWKQALWRLADDGSRVWLGPVPGGVHRIAISRHGDRFAVAQMTGRVAVYDGNRSVGVMPANAEVGDIAYAGTRLVLLAREAVTGWRLDGSLSAPVDVPGARRLLAVADRSRCLLVRDGEAPALVSIDEEDRHIPEVRLDPAATLASADASGRRLITRRAGGCVYWRDGAEVAHWPAAHWAAVSGDGHRIAVCADGQVGSYRDDG
jgi:hypothetical protein